MVGRWFRRIFGTEDADLDERRRIVRPRRSFGTGSKSSTGPPPNGPCRPPPPPPPPRPTPPVAARVRPRGKLITRRSRSRLR